MRHDITVIYSANTQSLTSLNSLSLTLSHSLKHTHTHGAKSGSYNKKTTPQII